MKCFNINYLHISTQFQLSNANCLSMRQEIGLHFSGSPLDCDQSLMERDHYSLRLQFIHRIPYRVHYFESVKKQFIHLCIQRQACQMHKLEPLDGYIHICLSKEDVTLL
jgi:hypothetical protein